MTNGSGWVAAALLGACVACGSAFEPAAGSGGPADAARETGGDDASSSSSGGDGSAWHEGGAPDAGTADVETSTPDAAKDARAVPDAPSGEACAPLACVPGQCGSVSNGCGAEMTCPSCAPAPPAFCYANTCTPMSAFTQCTPVSGCGSVAYADGGSQVCVEVASCNMTVGWWLCPIAQAPSCHQAAPNTPDWLVCCTGAEDPSKANGCGC